MGGNSQVHTLALHLAFMRDNNHDSFAFHDAEHFSLHESNKRELKLMS